MKSVRTKADYLPSRLSPSCALCVAAMILTACNDRRGSPDGLRDEQADSGVDERCDADADPAEDTGVTPGDVAEDAAIDAPSDIVADVGVPDASEDAPSDVDADAGGRVGPRSCLPGGLHEYRLPEGVAMRGNRIVTVDVDGDGDEDVLYTVDDEGTGFWLERTTSGFNLEPRGEVSLEGELLAARQVRGTGLVVVTYSWPSVVVWVYTPSGGLERVSTPTARPDIGQQNVAGISADGTVYLNAGGLIELTRTATGLQTRMIAAEARGSIVIDDARGVVWTYTPTSPTRFGLTRIAFDGEDFERRAVEVGGVFESDQLLLLPAWQDQPAELVIVSPTWGVTRFADATPLGSTFPQNPLVRSRVPTSLQALRGAEAGDLVIVAGGTGRYCPRSGRLERGIYTSIASAFTSDGEYEAAVKFGRKLYLLPHDREQRSRLHQIPSRRNSTWMSSSNPTSAGLWGATSDSATNVPEIYRWPSDETRTQPEQWLSTRFTTELFGLEDRGTDGTWPFFCAAIGPPPYWTARRWVSPRLRVQRP